MMLLTGVATEFYAPGMVLLRVVLRQPRDLQRLQVVCSPPGRGATHDLRRHASGSGRAVRRGIKVEQSWLSRRMWYSYGACNDAFSGPARGGPQNFATFDKKTCPYSKLRPYNGTDSYQK